MIAKLKKYADEFKTFAMRGNVIDMAVGIIIGAAFGKVVDSLVKDVIMPPLGWILGRVDFSKLYLVMPDYEGKWVQYPTLEAAQNAGAVTVNYGLFINTIISFLIVAFAVFLLIKAINKLQKLNSDECEKEEKETTKECPVCFSTIDIRAKRCPHCTSEI